LYFGMWVIRIWSRKQYQSILLTNSLFSSNALQKEPEGIITVKFGSQDAALACVQVSLEGVVYSVLFEDPLPPFSFHLSLSRRWMIAFLEEGKWSHTSLKVNLDLGGQGEVMVEKRKRKMKITNCKSDRMPLVNG
jgi:hypothetical protein